MSNQEQMPTWLEIFKGMPAHTKEVLQDAWDFWRRVPLAGWILQILMLVSLIAVFWYSTELIVYIFSQAEMPPKHSWQWWVVITWPFNQLIGIFLWQWLVQKIAKFIVTTLNLKILPDGS